MSTQTSIQQVPRSFENGWQVSGTENGVPFTKQFLYTEHDNACEAAIAFIEAFITKHSK